jgi:hypothetical protein
MVEGFFFIFFKFPSAYVNLYNKFGGDLDRIFDEIGENPGKAKKYPPKSAEEFAERCVEFPCRWMSSTNIIFVEYGYNRGMWLNDYSGTMLAAILTPMNRERKQSEQCCTSQALLDQRNCFLQANLHGLKSWAAKEENNFIKK